MPTPRPEISVTCSAVEKPGWKISWWISAAVSASPRRSAPAAIAFAQNPLGVQARAVVGDLDDDVAALVEGAAACSSRRRRLAGRGAHVAAARCRGRCCCGPCASADRSMSSTTLRSSSVSSPVSTSSIGLSGLAAQVADQARPSSGRSGGSAPCASPSRCAGGRVVMRSHAAPGCASAARRSTRSSAGSSARIACAITSSPTMSTRSSSFAVSTLTVLCSSTSVTPVSTAVVGIGSAALRERPRAAPVAAAGNQPRRPPRSAPRNATPRRSPAGPRRAPGSSLTISCNTSTAFSTSSISTAPDRVCARIAPGRAGFDLVRELLDRADAEHAGVALDGVERPEQVVDQGRSAGDASSFRIVCSIVPR